MVSLLKGAMSPALSSPLAQGSKRCRVGSWEPPCKRRATAAASPQAHSALKELAVETLPFSILTDGPYLEIASWLDARDLARTDAACGLLRSLNAQPSGPWKSVGDAEFFGMELDVGGGFMPFSGARPPVPVFGAPEHDQKRREYELKNWKSHYKLFHSEAPTFSVPFSSNEIKVVEHPDEVAYCRCRLRTDLLAARDDRGYYIEVEIRANADNLSLAVVDFEGGGRSSVTFSPETGAVLRERKVRESPRAIEGTYIHLLPAAPPGHRFEGVMGLYLRNGHLAFFRRWFVAPTTAAAPTEEGQVLPDDAEGAGVIVNASPPHPPTIPAVTHSAASTDMAVDVVSPDWETTGFCTDLSWASGKRLSLCLAFRDEGQYNVRIARVGRDPPIIPPKSEAAYQDGKWNHLYGDDDHPLAI